MDTVSHVMLENSCNCDIVRSNSVINLPREALFLNSRVAVDIFSLNQRQ